MPEIILVAEIGENHLGDIKIAKKLIKEAAIAGADYVKFQSYLPQNFRHTDPEREWFKKVFLSDKAHFELKEFAAKKGVKFISSPFSIERAKFLCEVLGLKSIKIASGMMLNFPLLDFLNRAKPDTVFLSTGMATLKEISLSLKHLDSIPNIYIMHCVTQYPCKDDEANLNAITTLKEKFNLPVGYSDHTIGIEACLVAAALGAKVIEKHFTFNKNFPEGTDHILSATAGDFREMASRIRRIELLLGSGLKQATSGEREIRQFIRQRFLKE